MKPSFLKYLGLPLLMLVFSYTAKAQCPPNIDFESNSFANWVCGAGSATVPATVPLPVTGPIAGRHTLVTTATAGVDPYGGFNTLCPNGSGTSVKLGNSLTGAQSESVTYTFTIPAAATSYSILFYYAVVLQDPVTGHTTAERPRFQARITDAANNPLPCVDFDFVATANLPGFLPSPFASNVWYKDWTPISLNLSAYAGQTLKLDFVTADCTRGGHFGYAYMDVSSFCNGVISGNFICPGDTAITLNAPFGFEQYEWYANATFTTLLSNTQQYYVNPLPAVGTTFPVVVTPYTGFGCKDTLYATIDVGVTPAANAGPDQTMCNNQPVQIGAAPNPNYSYLWNQIGQVSGPTLANPFAWALTAGPEEFIVLTTDIVTGCKASDTTYISATIVDTALAVNGKTTYCTGDPNAGSLSVSNTLASVQWYDGNTPIGGATGFTYMPGVTGNYWAQVIFGACTDSTRTIAFTITPTPVSVAGPDANICANQTIQIGAPPGPGLNYAWTPATNVSSSTISDPIAWVNNGIPVEFIVVTTEPISGCFSSDTIYITGRVVDTSMTASGKTTYCTGDPTPGTLTVNNNVTGIQWYDGNTQIPGATAITYQPTSSGSYWAEVQQSGCTDSTRTINFTITTTPVSVAGPDANICANATTLIGAAAVPGMVYSWTPVAQVSNPSISNPTAWVNNGTPVEFIVRTTEPTSGCYSQDTMYVTGRVVDTALSINGSTDYCTADLNHGVLSVNNTFTAIQWFDGNTPIPGATASTYQPTISGNYWAQVQQFACTDSTRTVPFAIHLTPLVLFSPSSDSSCLTSNSYLFTNNSNAPDGASMTYLWKFSDGTTSTLTDAVKTFAAAGTYTVKLITTTSFGCMDSTGLTTVHVMPNAKADFKWDSVCINRPSLFYNLSKENASPQVNYTWNFNNGSPVSNVKDPGPVTYTTAGTVDVTLIVTALGCENDPDSIVKKVQANVSKPGKKYKDITVPEGAKTFIHARDSVGQYFQWMPLIQLNNYNARYTEFTAINDVLYTIRISDLHTCVTVDTLQMLVLKKPGYYLPTAFTPNGDGLNDLARPYLVRMKALVSFSIFNRWGNRIFYSQQEGKGWDGKLNGEAQPSGVYVWILEFMDASNQKVTEKGTITLIR